MINVSIIGGGIAGYSAAITLSRSHVNVNLYTGPSQGGQIILAPNLDNYPGIITSGEELISNMRKQALFWKVNIIEDTIEKCCFNEKLLLYDSKNNEIQSDIVIIATGKKYNKLNIKSENKFLGRGLSYCAMCDGPLYNNKVVGVVGGGDSAAQAALYLVDFVKKVHLFVRSNKMRAFESTQLLLEKNEKIEIHYNSSVVDLYGDNLLEKIKLNDNTEVKLTGLFVAIGSDPETYIFKDFIKINSEGYIITDSQGRTNIKHVYAAGDVTAHSYKQAIIAAGDGCTAAITALRDLKK